MRYRKELGFGAAVGFDVLPLMGRWSSGTDAEPKLAQADRPLLNVMNAIDLPVCQDHVADTDADARLRPAQRSALAVMARRLALDFHRVLHRFHRARELGEDIVARRIDDAATMLPHMRVQ